MSFAAPYVRIGDIELDNEAELDVDDLLEPVFFSPTPSLTSNTTATIIMIEAMIKAIASHVEQEWLACKGHLLLSSSASFFATSGKSCS